MSTLFSGPPLYNSSWVSNAVRWIRGSRDLRESTRCFWKETWKLKDDKQGLPDGTKSCDIFLGETPTTHADAMKLSYMLGYKGSGDVMFEKQRPARSFKYPTGTFLASVPVNFSKISVSYSITDPDKANTGQHGRFAH